MFMIMHAARHARRAALALSLAALLPVAVACGSGDAGGSDATPATPVRPEGNIEPIPSIAGDPLDVPLSRTESITGLYTVEVPPGWQHVGQLNASQEEIFRLDDSQGHTQAEIGITCEPIPTRADGAAWQPVDFAQRDIELLQAVIRGVEGDLQSITVGDLQGVAMTYGVSIGPLTIRQQAVYLVGEGDDCMWELRLRVFAGGAAEDVLRLFGRMVGTFRPA